MNNENSITAQNIAITDRSRIVLTGISSVDSFDENYICATTVNNTVISVEGSNLEIRDVNLEKGVIEAGGMINGVFYSENNVNKKSFLKLFGR